MGILEVLLAEKSLYMSAYGIILHLLSGSEGRWALQLGITPDI